MAQEKEPNLESLPEVHHEVDAEKAGIFINARGTIAEINNELMRLDKSEEGLEETVRTMQDQGEAEPEIVESAVEAEEASVLRIEDRKEQLEGRKEEMGDLLKVRNKFLKGWGILTGTDVMMLNADKIAKKFGGEDAGLFTYDERIEMWERKGEMTRGLSKIMAPFLPGWGKALLVGGEKIVHINHTVMAEAEKRAKDGEKMTSKEANIMSFQLLSEELHIDKLKDLKNIEKLGDALIEFGGDFGGEIGDKFKYLGELAKKHPDKISKALVTLKDLIDKGDVKVDDDTEKAIAEMDHLEEDELKALGF